MGAVYEALQDNPRRTVALKVINAGAVSASLLRRFEHEAQVLGRLQHPGIAQIFEAGTFDLGHGVQPFFAMEFIRGEPLNEFAQRRNLGTRQRLDLLSKVCDAVQHAHQRGIIHRDLKPANILVDETGQPKVLDFGVARATDGDVQTTTLRTDIGQLIGTIPYMSPEQAAGDPDDLDTRSDVYAIGVIGYQLLTGRMPYDLKAKMIHEAVRVIREDDPTPLSSVNRVFAGDIDTIIGKALEKDKTRRYESASAMSDDLRRYLRDEPITARPPTTWYQVRKFAARNRVLVGGVAAVFAILLAASVVSTLLFLRADAQRVRAEGAEQLAQERFESAERARVHAERMVERSEKTDHFLRHDLLMSVRPDQRGPDVTVREVLDNASGALDGAFPDDPAIEGQLRRTLGSTYSSIAEYEAAEVQLLRALETLTAAHGATHQYVLVVRNELGTLYNRWERYDDAEPWLRDSVRDNARELGADHPATQIARHNLAFNLTQRGRLEEGGAPVPGGDRDAPTGVGPGEPRGVGQHGHAGLALPPLGTAGRGATDVRGRPGVPPGRAGRPPPVDPRHGVEPRRAARRAR